MHTIHTTRDGKKMFVAQMHSEHLKNAILLKLRNLNQALGLVGANAVTDKRHHAIYQLDLESIQDRVSEVIPVMLQKLYPFITEAVLRGVSWLPEVTTQLQEIMGRSGPDLEHLCLTAAFKEVGDLVDDLSDGEDWGNFVGGTLDVDA